MPGIADLFYFGRPDPSRQLAALLAGQQPPGAAPPGAAPTPPGGAAAPDAPAPDAAPMASGSNPAPGQPAPPNAPPTPNALKSPADMSASYQTLANPPNLMSLYQQMYERDRASDQMNRGFALIAANYSSPAMAQAIMQSVNGGQDASQHVGDLMSLYQGQQQMAAQQAMLGQAPAIAAKLGLPEEVVRARILAGGGADLVKPMEAPEHAREYDWFANKFADEHQNDPGPDGQPLGRAGARKLFEDQNPPMLAMGGISGLRDPATRSMTMAGLAWDRDPANKDKTKPLYLTDPDKWRIHETQLTDASTQFSGVNERLGNYINTLGDVSSDDNLDKVVGGNLVQQIINKGKAAFPGTPEYNLAFRIGGLGGLSKAVAGAPGSRPGDFATIGANLEDFNKTGMSSDEYQRDVIQPRMRAALVAQANAWAAAGKYNSMPGYLRLYADPVYGQGGELDMGGSPKAGRPADKDRKPVTEAEMPVIRGWIETYGPRKAKELADQAHYDMSLFD